MKTYGESGGIAALFFTLAVDGEWSASRNSRFIPGERDPGTHWIGGWVDPRSGFERCGVEKDFLPLSGIEHRPYNL
jgi:hypothetical protein